MRRVWDEASRLATSSLTLVEVCAALVRAARGGRLSPRGLRAATSSAAVLLAELDLVEPERDVLDQAADLAERYALRAYDAVHLASAMALRDPEVVVATWDHDLRAASSAEGFAIAG
jgi:hypothetical protein